MSKMLVAVFDEEKQAFKASQALLDLHRDGAITAYAGAVVARDADGKLSVKDEADEGPIGTALGMLTGALAGILAGPVGVVAGATFGGMMGATADLINLGVGTDFVDEVAAQLAPGKVAVVAEIDEGWVTPVDTRMEELGGTVIRRNRVDVEDEQIGREIAAIEADYAELKAELKAANEANKEKLKADLDAAKAKLDSMGENARAEYEEAKAKLEAASDENKAKLQVKLDETKAKLAAARDRAKTKLEMLNAEGEAKVEAIEKQIADARAETKQKLEQRKAELKADYDRRSGKLHQAWELTKEAFA